MDNEWIVKNQWIISVINYQWIHKYCKIIANWIDDKLGR